MIRKLVKDLNVTDIRKMTNEELYYLRDETLEGISEMPNVEKALNALAARIYTQQIEINELRDHQITDHNVALLEWAKRQLELGRIVLSVENNVLVVIEKKEESNAKMG